MKTTIKNLSDTKLLFTITLDKADLATAETTALKKLSKELKVAGFRKGKVPFAVAQKNVDPRALQDQALDDAVSKAVSETFISHSIQALDRPTIEIKKYVPTESVEFTADVEILPKITLGDYKKLKITTAKPVVSAAEVQEIIERMRQGFSEKKVVTRAAKNGDETIIDFVGKKDGVAFEGGTGVDYALTLGSNSFIPGFEKAIEGKKPGDTFDVALAFPQDYHVAHLKGQDVVFTTTLKEIKEVVLPKVDDEFAAKSGPFTSVAELKADIKRELTAQKEREGAEKVKDDLVGQLIEKSSVPTPDILISDQMKSIEQDFERNLTYQGLTVDQYLEAQKFAHKDEWLTKEVRPTAIKRVKAGLVLAELSKVEKVHATHDELTAHIDMYRAQYANNAEALKQFEDPEVQRDIGNRLLTEKTVELLVILNTPKK